MEKQDKFRPFEIVGLIVIALILLYFPYKCVTEHEQDNVAMSYYHEGK